MSERHRRLGERLQLAREARRPRLSQSAAAQALGVGRTTIQNIESGKFSSLTENVREYARLLGIEDAELYRAMEGVTEAAAADAEPAPAPEPERLPLPPAVEYELRSSETLEAQVITLGPDDDDGHVIVVLQGKKGATPEEVARIAERYRKVRRSIQSVADSDETVSDS
ncbi:helix-turn-helix domain-containing protein [Streptomyces antibioticus]|uniref:helix-turn-helix domain-containing protein n=1 Tax=Streptomyces antibioticus TaxID=1890 RepID=UPI003F478D3D